MKDDISPDKVVVTSILVDVLDIVVNLAVSILTGSAVMIAEAFEGISDFVSATFVYLGLKRSRQKYDEIHPFGHGRWVYFGVLLAGIIMLLITSVITILIGVNKLLNPAPIDTLWIAYLTLGMFTLTNGYSLNLAIKRLKKEKDYKNILESMDKSVMIETKTTLILDLAGTLSAVTGLINLIAYGITGNQIFDGLGAITIGAILGVLTVFLIKSAADLLIGRKASDLTEHKIRKTVLSIKNVDKIISLKTMNIGIDQLLVNVEIHIKHSLKTTQIENLTNKVKEKIRKETPEVTHVNVEIGKIGH